MKAQDTDHSSVFSKLLLMLFLTIFFGCGSDNGAYDASGVFEADETIISAEVQGILKAFTVREGQRLTRGQALGYIDTIQLHLQKLQLEAQINAILSRRPDIKSQMVSLREQLKAAEIEQQRIQKLFDAEAATPRQLDDINSRVAVIKGNIDGLYSSLSTSSASLVRETEPVTAQVRMIEDRIERSKLTSPTNGTVLMTYANQYEMVSPGKPLYKMADLSDITLKVYVTGDQLPGIKLNQEVTIQSDDGEGGYLENPGTIYWISNEAEFTPKSIQTKDERADKVYAVKVSVPNDGTYKIGMYGQVKF